MTVVTITVPKEKRYITNPDGSQTPYFYFEYIDENGMTNVENIFGE